MNKHLLVLDNSVIWADCSQQLKVKSFVMTFLTIGLKASEIRDLGIGIETRIHYQSAPGELVQQCLLLDECRLADTGALAVKTGIFTGRSPKDRYIVSDEKTADNIFWGEVNIALSTENYDRIFKNICDYFENRPSVWIRDAIACADESFQLKIRAISEKPWTDLFIYNMFIRPEESMLKDFLPEWKIYCAPGLQLDAEYCGIRQSNAVVINFSKKTILIAGTGYTGETKKGIFSVLNFLLPLEEQVLSMHCAANMGREGDTALFFGLSGTGKTTLSADPQRMLIGDDEHGWSDRGIFNFEGGCYAKTIDLSPEKEPQIYSAIKPGALLENIVFHPGSDRVDFSAKDITENTRVSYPLHFIDNALIPSVGPQPKNIFFLTCDAFGVLPPISKLSAGQALYHFISGYTAKVAGTETGIIEPKPTFSACFGGPFLPLHPGFYASLLGEKIRNSGATIWLVNTGWTGGAYGVGKRISLKYTRTMISAALDGSLAKQNFRKYGYFGLEIPENCPGLPAEILDPEQTWADKEAYQRQAEMLLSLFTTNFARFEKDIDPSLIELA